MSNERSKRGEILSVEGVTVRVTVRSNCRRMILRFHPETGEAALSVPPGPLRRDVRTFLQTHADWLAERARNQMKPTLFAPGERHLLLGKWVTLGQGTPSGEAFLNLRHRELVALLTKQLAQWEKRLGVHATHVTLRDMTSRWGSCRKETGHLTFNTRLGCLPEELVEYVVVHELCHLVHANHSAQFWALVAACLPDWKTRRDAINRFDLRSEIGAAQ